MLPNNLPSPEKAAEYSPSAGRLVILLAMPNSETYLDRAIAAGHAELTGEGKHQRIRYTAADRSERCTDSEEQVRAEFLAELIYRCGHEPECIGLEATVPRRTPAGHR
jgi:hypothetical protein